MVKLILQPEGSSLCGQTCVAMLAGVTLEKSIEAFGKCGATRTKEVSAALAVFDLQSDNRLRRINRNTKVPDTCIIKMCWKNKKGKNRGHWILRHDGRYYDPAYGVIFGDYPPEWGKLTSFIEIDGMEKKKEAARSENKNIEKNSIPKRY